MKKAAAMLLALMPMASMAQEVWEPTWVWDVDLSEKARQQFDNRSGGEGQCYNYFGDGWNESTEWMEETKHEVTASSYLAQQGNYKYTPDMANDGDEFTAWVEGVNGDGKGQKITFKFAPSKNTINCIRIFNGYVKSPSAYYNNARPKKIRLYIDGKATYDFIMKEDKPGEYVYHTHNTKDGEDIRLDNGKTFEFEILEVYPGKKWQDCAITDIVFDGTGIHD